MGGHCLLRLTAIYCPKEVAVLHYKAHSRDGSKVAEGNQLADCQVGKAALYETLSLQMPLFWTGPVEQEKHNMLRKNWKDMREEEQRLLIKNGYSPRMND